ncbi:MAG: lipoate--protein ligase family protein [Verrucomicrobia bacterium]|nr:lipoate--protein ligase family protein [Verrucomicrobiota bacterium]
MLLLDVTLPTPAENLACDEALLDQCDAGCGDEVLRFWEPTSVFVVLGYANRAASELNTDTCDESGVPVLRRISGGGTVLQAPGCLNYALVLRTSTAAELQTTGTTNRYVMEKHRFLLEKLLGAKVAIDGVTDLVVRGRKVSGNAQRRRANAVLFHGTFLLNAPVELMGKYLRMPSRSPAYRDGRPHEEFVANLGIDCEVLKAEISRLWKADQRANQWPEVAVERLVRTKYSLREWNLRF